MYSVYSKGAAAQDNLSLQEKLLFMHVCYTVHYIYSQCCEKYNVADRSMYLATQNIVFFVKQTCW